MESELDMVIAVNNIEADRRDRMRATAIEALRAQFIPEYAETYIEAMEEMHDDNFWLTFIRDDGQMYFGPLIEHAREFIREHYDLVRGDGQHKRSEKRLRKDKRKRVRRSRKINRHRKRRR